MDKLLLYTILTLIGIFAFQGIRTMYALLSSLKFLRKQQVKNLTLPTSKIRFFVLIPCLCEQKKIKETLEYFDSICKPLGAACSIYVITTEKELLYTNSNFTWDIAKSEIKKRGYANMEIIHYPNQNGIMAHQLNYGVAYLKEYKLLTAQDYIVLYNADSRPHSATFSWVANSIEKNGFMIYQQLSTVFQNFDMLGNSLNGLLLKAFAVLQTRFSLAHELPRLRRTTSKNYFLRRYSNAHCIGHGLFIPYGKLQHLHNFSEKTMTEDLFLGFLMRASGNPILPIPFFENIDSPMTIYSNIKQKYVWFWGPMYYPHYYRYYRHNFSTRKHSFSAFALMMQGLWSAVAWMVSGPILILALIVGILNADTLLGATLIIFVLIYAPVQFLLILRKFNSIILFTTGRSVAKRGFIESLSVALLSPVAILLSSLPTYGSVIMEVYRSVTGKMIQKPKTDSL